MNASRKTRVAVIFGGRSGEHEVSLASARSVMAALDPERYEALSVGITPDGQWLTSGDPLKQLTDRAAQPRLSAAEATSETLARTESSALTRLTASGDEASSSHPLALADVVFPVLHGPYGEDGTVQGLLELLSLPYVGAGVAASAVGMDKMLMKAAFAAAGLPQVPWIVVLRHEWERLTSEGADGQAASALLDRIEATLAYPLFVKPANLGSSVGVSRADDRAELIAALHLAARYDRKMIVEQGVAGAREVEFSVLGNDQPEVSVAGEIVPHTNHTFYDYEAKYTPGEADLVIPASLPDDVLAEMQAIAVRAFQAIDGSGMARVDFLVDPVTLAVFLNEVNTIPGFTATSMYSRLWEASGLPYPQLLERLIDLALERHADKQRNAIARPTAL